MTGAFQKSAFQFTGFQMGTSSAAIVVNTGSGDDQRKKYYKWKREKKYRYKKLLRPTAEVKQFVKKYEEARKTIDQQESIILLSAVDPFIFSINPDRVREQIRSELVSLHLPSPKNINFEALLGNALAVEKFNQSMIRLDEIRKSKDLEAIKALQRQEQLRILQENQDDEDLMIIAMMALND